MINFKIVITRLLDLSLLSHNLVLCPVNIVCDDYQFISDCTDLLSKGETTLKIINIDPDGLGAFKVSIVMNAVGSSNMRIP